MSQAQQITPSRMNLAVFKQKIIAARKGHELLKKKCDALKTRFRTIMIALLDTKRKMGEEAQEALLLFAKAQWAAGDFHQNVKDAVKRATIRIDMTSDNVAGVMLPIMHIRELDDADSNLNQIGMDRGGAQIQRARDKFKELLALLIQIAGFQTSFVTLDQVIKVTNRRVNALEHVVIPKFIDIVQYINQELDEISREEFYRLKKVLDNKKKLVEAEKLDTEKRLKELQAKGKQQQNNDQGSMIEDDQKVDPDILQF